MWSRLFRAVPWCPTPLDPGCRAIQHHLHSWQQHTTTIGQAKSSLSFAFKFTFLWWTLSSLQRIAWHTPKSRMVNANTPHTRRLHQCGSKIFDAPLQPVARPCILDQLTMNFGCGSSDQILRRGPREELLIRWRCQWKKVDFLRPRSPSKSKKSFKMSAQFIQVQLITYGYLRFKYIQNTLASMVEFDERLIPLMVNSRNWPSSHWVRYSLWRSKNSVSRLDALDRGRPWRGVA